MAAGDELLVLDQVNKHFGGLKVIVDLDFGVNEEEIVGLIGPNGAGKTTVFNLITSIYTPGWREHHVQRPGDRRHGAPQDLPPRASPGPTSWCGPSSR